MSESQSQPQVEEFEDRADRFLQGRMNAQERQEFENELVESPELADQVRERLDLAIGIWASERVRLQQRLQQLQPETGSGAASQTQAETKPGAPLKRQTILWGLFVLALLAVALALYLVLN